MCAGTSLGRRRVGVVAIGRWWAGIQSLFNTLNHFKDGPRSGLSGVVAGRWCCGVGVGGSQSV